MNFIIDTESIDLIWSLIVHLKIKWSFINIVAKRNLASEWPIFQSHQGKWDVTREGIVVRDDDGLRFLEIFF